MEPIRESIESESLDFGSNRVSGMGRDSESNENMLFKNSHLSKDTEVM